MNHRPLRTCESELTYPCTHHLQAFANNVILIRFTTNSHSGNSFIMHGLSQTLLTFSNLPQFPSQYFHSSQSSKLPTYKPSSCELSKMGTYIWFQQGTRTSAINIRHGETAAYPQSPTADDGPLALPSPLPLSPPVRDFLACSPYASPCRPAVALFYYCIFQGTVLQD